MREAIIAVTAVVFHNKRSGRGEIFFIVEKLEVRREYHMDGMIDTGRKTQAVITALA